MRTAFRLSLLLLAASCGGGYPAAAVCQQASQCATGLSCLATPSVQFTTVGGQDAGCTQQALNSTCTIACASDSDCASLKAPSGVNGSWPGVNGSWKCFTGCSGATGTCGFAG